MYFIDFIITCIRNKLKIFTKQMPVNEICKSLQQISLTQHFWKLTWVICDTSFTGHKWTTVLKLVLLPAYKALAHMTVQQHLLRASFSLLLEPPHLLLYCFASADFLVFHQTFKTPEKLVFNILHSGVASVLFVFCFLSFCLFSYKIHFDTKF